MNSSTPRKPFSGQVQALTGANGENVVPITANLTQNQLDIRSCREDVAYFRALAAKIRNGEFPGLDQQGSVSVSLTPEELTLVREALNDFRPPAWHRELAARELAVRLGETAATENAAVL